MYFRTVFFMILRITGLVGRSGRLLRILRTRRLMSRGFTFLGASFSGSSYGRSSNTRLIRLTVFFLTIRRGLGRGRLTCPRRNFTTNGKYTLGLYLGFSGCLVMYFSTIFVMVVLTVVVVCLGSRLKILVISETISSTSSGSSPCGEFSRGSTT